MPLRTTCYIATVLTHMFCAHALLEGIPVNGDAESRWSDWSARTVGKMTTAPVPVMVSNAPRLPQRSYLRTKCSVVEFGAVGDNHTEDTLAVQQAIDNCTTVVFPSAYTFLLRPIELSHSNLHLVFESNSTVVAWGDIATWDPASNDSRPALFWSHGSVLMQNISIIGMSEQNASGLPLPTIDGQGWRWWPFGKTIRRPLLLSISMVQELHIEGMRFKDSPAFHVAVKGDRITMFDNRVEANMASCDGYGSAPNTDAYNIGGTNIYLRGNFNHNGDDGIPLNDGPGGGITQNVLVENHHSECGTNSGVVIIGSGNHTIRDVIFRNITALHLNQGAGMKISEAYESVIGQAMNVTWQDVRIMSPRDAAIYINVFAEDAAIKQCTPPTNATKRQPWLSAFDLTFRNITATMMGGALAGCFNCAPTRPCTGIIFENVIIHNATSKYVCNSIQGVSKQSSPQACGATTYHK
eukprot:m.62079 g.62079  ORF g.62079 m.62079 type:complete len:467 (+) comp23080_c0_seq1:45-1445(+)